MERKAWNKLVALLISIVLVSGLCFTAFAEDAAESEFTIEGKTLVKYNGRGGEVTVPEGIEVLGGEAFQSSDVTKVYLPETVREIGHHCFYSCSLLTEITLPASLEGLENSTQAFGANYALEAFSVAEGGNYITVDGVLFTADGKTLVFYPEGKRDTEYSIPEGTEKLGESSVKSSRLETLNIPSTLKSVGRDYVAFVGLPNLREINVFPDNKTFRSIDGVLYTSDTLMCYPNAKQGKELKAGDFPAGLKRIAHNSFWGNEYLENVEFPEGLEYLGGKVFLGARSLKTVVIPASIKTISYYTFAVCMELERVTILNPDIQPEDITVDNPKKYNIFWDAGKNAVLCGYAGGGLQKYAEKCGLNFEALGTELEIVDEIEAESAMETVQDIPETGTKPAETSEDDFVIEGKTLVQYVGAGGEVTVPEGIEKLASEAFQDTAVTKVNLPETLKTVGHHCFYECRKLKEITIPASLEGLENTTQAFGDNYALETFNVAEGGNYITVDGVLFTASGKTLVYYPTGKQDAEYSIPEGTEKLGESCIDASWLETLNIPSTLKSAGRDYVAFVGLPNLREINVSPDNKVFRSVDGVLYNSDTLLCYPNEKREKELKAEDFPAGLKHIAHDSFWGNRHLETLELPEGLEYLGSKVFFGAQSLKTVVIPASVKYISSHAFAFCPALERVTILNPDIQPQDMYDDEPETYNIFWKAAKGAVLCGYAGGGLQAYAERCGLNFETLGTAPETAAESVKETVQDIPEAGTAPAESNEDDFIIEGKTLVEYIGKGGEVTVPEGVEVLAEWAFRNARVTKVNLPETLKEIECYCFYQCRQLKEITLPASLEKIGTSQSFAYNGKLEEIKVAEGNEHFVSVDGVLFTSDRTKLLYYPTGKNWGGEYAIPEGTRTIGGSAVAGTGLTAIELPSTFVRMHNGNDFADNPELKEIRVAENNPVFRSVDGMLFDNSGTLISYPSGREQETLEANDFPAEMKAIGPYAFQFVQHLKNVEIPEGIKTIEWMCFTFSPSLESVTLPASVNNIAGYAFSLCPNLKKVTILNPDAMIGGFSNGYGSATDNNIFNHSPNAVLYGYENSTTQKYAAQINAPFESIGEAPDGTAGVADPLPDYVPECQR